MTNEVEDISPPQKVEKVHIPEYNAVQKLNGLLRAFGKVTAQTRIRSKAADGGHIAVDRPLSLRTNRAALYHEARQARRIGDTGRLRQIFDDGHVRDKIALQYLNQGEVTVNLPGLGEQMAKFTFITPPRTESADQPPIVLIPGISNDLDCVGALAQEIPYKGRSLVVIGFPDSFMGSVTDPFADAVASTPTYGPHTEFFKQAITKILQTRALVEFELWGFSTGAPIAAEMLTDPEFQKRVTNAAFLSPASSTDFTKAHLDLGIARETGRLLHHFGSVGNYTLTQGRTPDVEEEAPGQRKIKERIFNSLLTKVRTPSSAYRDARVRDEGHITVVSGEEDHMTESSRADPTFLANPQVQLLSLKDGSHTSPLTQPSRVLAGMNALRLGRARHVTNRVF